MSTSKILPTRSVKEQDASTFASALTFFSVIGLSPWLVIAGLLIGGVLAAPLGARLAGKLPVRTMFVLVGVVVIFWSARVLWGAW